MKNVDFTYPNGTQALYDVSLKVDSGKITALVGLSGAGKSTIVNLLDKFYEPDCGTITLDGVDLRDWDTHYWAQSPIPNPQSPIPNPQSPIPNPQSPIPNPQSPIPNPQSPIFLRYF